MHMEGNNSITSINMTRMSERQYNVNALPGRCDILVESRFYSYIQEVSSWHTR